MSYILLRSNLNGSNPLVLVSVGSDDARLPAFASYCASNNIAIKDWDYRLLKDVVGLFASSQLNDTTNYTLYQVYQLPDWEGDPSQNFWVNDIGMFRWIPIPIEYQVL